MIKIASVPNRRALGLGLFAALILLAAGINAQKIDPKKPQTLELKKPNVSLLPDFEVIDIEFIAPSRILAKIRNNSPTAFSGKVEMGLQIAGYGLVYRDRLFNFDLAGGQVVTMEMPCDVPAEKMRMDSRNAIGIFVGIDQNNKIPEVNENNNIKHIEVPYGITGITLTLLPSEYQGKCPPAPQVKVSARIAFRCNLKLTEQFMIVLENPKTGFRKEFQEADYFVTANPGTLTITKEILLSSMIGTEMGLMGGELTLRVELNDRTAKNVVSNKASFTYRCL